VCASVISRCDASPVLDASKDILDLVALLAELLVIGQLHLAVVDDYSRECVRRIAETSISGARVGRKLDAAVFERMARPHTIVSDNGIELTSMAILC